MINLILSQFETYYGLQSGSYDDILMYLCFLKNPKLMIDVCDFVLKTNVLLLRLESKFDRKIKNCKCFYKKSMIYMTMHKIHESSVSKPFSNCEFIRFINPSFNAMNKWTLTEYERYKTNLFNNVYTSITIEEIVPIKTSSRVLTNREKKYITKFIEFYGIDCELFTEIIKTSSLTESNRPMVSIYNLLVVARIFLSRIQLKLDTNISEYSPHYKNNIIYVSLCTVRKFLSDYAISNYSFITNNVNFNINSLKMYNQFEREFLISLEFNMIISNADIQKAGEIFEDDLLCDEIL